MSVQKIIEEFDSDELDQAIYVGILNGRGETVRMSEDGGDQELRLCDRFATRSRQLSTSAPRTAALLRRLAEKYRSEARYEDDRRDLNEYWH